MKKIKRVKKITQPTYQSASIKESTIETPNRLLIFFLALLVLVALFLLLNIFGKGKGETLKNKVIPEAIKKVVGDPKTSVTINSIKEASGVYEFEMSLGIGSAARKYTSYITKNGKIIFTSGIKVADLNKQTAQTGQQQKKLTCNDLTKVEAPKLTAFIVSQCPFGIQMQRVFKKVLNEQPDLSTNLNIKYIGNVSGDKITAMHGDAEATENLKQICIREEQSDKYWPYISCYMQEGKSDDCSITTGIDTLSLKACTTDKTRGLAFAKKDFDLANKLQIGSSPTLVLNDKQVVSEFDFGGRIANSLKQIVCCGSKTQGDYCKTDLSKDEVATSFSTTDAPQQGASSSAANCGN